MALSFVIDHQSSHSKARTGHVAHPSRPSAINTPCVWSSSQRGILAALTPDQLETSAEEFISGAHIALEHLLDHAPPLYKRNPSKDASLSGYFGYPSLQQNGPLLLMGVKDPSRLIVDSLKGTSGDHHIGIQTVKGFAKLTIDDYLRHVLPSPSGNRSAPDMLICATDEPDDALPSKKRLHKSIRRSVQWTHQVIHTMHKQNNNIPLLVQLVGSSNPDARLAFSQDLVDPDTPADFGTPSAASLDESIWGYAMRLPPLSRALSSQHVSDLFNKSLEPLSPNKFRLATGPSGPHAILHLIRNVGVDAFVEDFTWRLADAGVALDFDFGQLQPDAVDTGLDIGINLFDPIYEHDFSPLSKSTLAESSWKQQPLTRAYLHHLLNVHELSAHILLTLHNTRVVNAFLAQIQNLISTGDDTFQQQCDLFNSRYAEPAPGQPLPCTKASLEAKARVDKERGKGRTKGSITVEDVPVEKQIIDQ